MTRFTAQFTVAATVAGTMLLAGCGNGGTTSATPTSTTTEAPLPCDASGPTGQAVCAAQRMERAWKEAADQSAADDRGPFDWIHHPLLVLIGGVFLIGGLVTALRTREPLKDMPAHRNQAGTLAGVLTTDARHDATFGWLGVAAAPVLAAGGLGAPIPAVAATVVVGGLMAWIVSARVKRLGVVKSGYGIEEQRWRARCDAAGTLLPETILSESEAYDVGLTGGFEAPAGSAAAVMLSVDGRIGPTRAAWSRVAHAMKLGDTDEAGRFTPFATIAGVVRCANGDIEVTWNLHGIGRTESDMSRGAGPLLRELKVKEMPGGFRRNVSTGQVVATFSNGGAPAPGPAAAGPNSAPPADDDWDF